VGNSTEGGLPKKWAKELKAPSHVLACHREEEGGCFH
jgi:hypothetical protein